MTEQTTATTETPVAISPVRTLAVLFGSGALAGVISIGLAVVLERYIFARILCGPEGVICESASSTGAWVAFLVGALAALSILVAQRIYRPLMVVIMVSVALWGIATLVGVISGGFLQAAVAAGLLGVAYAFFGHVATIRNFYIALLVSIIVVVIVRILSSVV